MSEMQSILQTADTFFKLIWRPQAGDRVSIKGMKDVIAYVDKDGRAYLTNFPQQPYKASELNFRPTPEQYLSLISMFSPNIIQQLTEIKPRVFFAKCHAGPFVFAAQGKPKALLARLLAARLHLVAVNNEVNRIVELARSAGVNNAPKLRIVQPDASI